MRNIFKKTPSNDDDNDNDDDDVDDDLDEDDEADGNSHDVYFCCNAAMFVFLPD